MRTIGSELVQSLEAAYESIRARHPELPPVVVITGQGFDGRKKSNLGHFAGGAWSRSADHVDEIFVAGETLQLGAREVLVTLLHESVHALARVRKVKDTSRGGRYHNARFVVLAGELGLKFEGEPHGTLGYSNVQPEPATLEHYSSTLAALELALVVHRRRPGAGPDKKKSTNNAKAMCSCGRVIRVSLKVLEQAPIVCGECQGPFEAEPTAGEGDDGQGET